MYKLITLLVAIGLAGLLQAQTIFEENFEDGALPAGWSVETESTDGGWNISDPSAISSGYFEIPSNGSSFIAGTNDDACNCDKSQDYLITPVIDLSAVSSAVLFFDLFYGAQSYQGAVETAFIRATTDGGNSWDLVQEIAGVAGWMTTSVDLSAYAGSSTLQLAFHYNDNGGWLYGMAIDNVEITEPIALDVELTSLDIEDFGVVGDEFAIQGVFSNQGGETITSIDLSYSVDGGAPVVESLTGLSINAFTASPFVHSMPFIPTTEGTYTIDVAISNPNNAMDLNAANDMLSTSVDVFGNVVIPNIVDDYFLGEPIYEQIASASDGLNRPTDVDFFPILDKKELWVINERTENMGGSTLTIYEAGTPDQDMLQRVDGNAWHFMSLPTALSFGDNGLWASSPGVLDANHGGGTFTGPTLWESDPAIYAQPSGGNGSHMDMLHGSPYSMGIEHEVDNVYWVYDSHNGHPVRYDFGEDHGPGNDDHSDGKVRRYPEIELNRDGNLPSHLVLDKTTGWMYIVDNAQDRVLRLDINSGSVLQALNEINEPLAEHAEIGNVTWEVIIDSGLDRPSGIDLIDNRLLVSDYATGDIIAYDIEDNFAELGRIETGSEGICGIIVGPEGNIWYANRLLNEVTKIIPDSELSTYNPAFAANITISPNPTTAQTTISFENAIDGEISVLDLTGRILQTEAIGTKQHTLNLAAYSAGIYIIKIQTENAFYSERIVKK